MKTTVDISDALVREAKKIAAREGMSIKALIEEGLRQAILERKRTKAFRLRKVTYKGKGLSAEAEQADWNQIRELAYEGRLG